MARKSQTTAKKRAAAAAEKGNYGPSLKLQAKTKAKAAAKAEWKKGDFSNLPPLSFKLRSSDKPPKRTSSPSPRKKNKSESAAKKSVGKSNKTKVKTNHHVAKFSKNSIKERVNHFADRKQSSHNDRRFGKFATGNKPTRSDRKKRKKKQAKPEFSLNIADSNHEFFLRAENVPWYEAEGQLRFRENYTAIPAIEKDDKIPCASSNINSGKTSEYEEETLRLPSDKVLSRIDAEIQSFSAYVKLTPSERRARNAFLSHITEILTSNFGNKNRHRQKSDEDDKIYVEPFGSYATQDVCTFASDVDMCLWGLVRSEQPNSHVKFVSNSDGTEDVEDTSCILNDKKGVPLLTESSLLRAMDAIQSAQTKSREQSNSAKIVPSSNKGDTIESVTDDCLFVIDRVGEEAEEEKKEDVAPDLEDTKARSSDAHTGNNNSSSELQNSRSQSSNKEAKSKLKKNNTPKESFQFVIDRDGVRELGGEIDDLPISPNNTHDTSEATNSQQESMNASIGTPTKSITIAAGTPAGKTREKAINIDDESADDDDEVIVIDDDSSDEADKLESFYSRQSNSEFASAATRSSRRSGEQAGILTHAASKQDENDAISVGDSNDESEQDHNINSKEVLELSVTSASQSMDTSKPISKPVFGPTGQIRNRVVSVLQGLTSHLRRSSFTNTVECRSRARVPIVNCNTRTGFEGDIAIGGHNGTDTSAYAQTQVVRFKSFASIVLILKILMVQQSLDKPFTGGLGSYKLYVLVAHHIEHHLANGGNDRPSEILISLLFRYACVGSIKDNYTTDLESIRNSEGLIASDEGVCDLAPVFRIPDIVEMFRECHERLLDRLLLAEGFDDGKGSDNLSYLSSLIDCFRLKEARESSDRRSKVSDEITRPVGRDHPGKVNPSRRVGKVFSKNEFTTMRQTTQSQMDNTAHESRKRLRPANDTSYNPPRGPRGGLIPLHRPDVAAMRSMRANPEQELLHRGTKNRKNKKKQARDDALRVFSRRSI